MYIDDWDINEAGGRQWTVTMGNQTVSSASEWMPGSLIPALSEVRFGFKTCTVMVLVYGDSRIEARRGISEILGHLTEPVELRLDGFETVFRGVLKGHSVTEQKRIAGWDGWRRFLQLQLTLEGYEHGEAIMHESNTEDLYESQTESFTLANPGTGRTPVCIHIECQPSVSVYADQPVIDEVRILGLPSGDIILPRSYSYEIFDLDGETGLLTSTDPDGNKTAIADGAEIWELPYIDPGTTDISVVGAGVDAVIRITYNPRYL